MFRDWFPEESGSKRFSTADFRLKKDLSTPDLIFQIGEETYASNLDRHRRRPVRRSLAERMISKFADQPVAVLSKEHLIKNKLASARTQDLANVKR